MMLQLAVADILERETRASGAWFGLQAWSRVAARSDRNAAAEVRPGLLT